MAEPLFELLVPYFDSADAASRPRSPATDPTAAKYLNRLTTLSLSALKTTERQSLSQASHSNLLSLQALSNRSHKAFITSADNLSSLRTSIPKLAEETNRLRNAIPKLDEEAVRFSSTYSKNAENQTLDRRKQAMQLARNVDRLSDILELPALLATAVSSSSVNTGASSTSYSSALDLFAHIRRLQTLYPDSPLMKDIAKQAENALKDMTSNLIAGLRVQNIRLAAAIRTVGWLRRVAPELETATGPTGSTGVMQGEGAFGALFLVCRLANLITMLEALEPLRELADQETKRRLHNDDNPAAATSNSTLFRYEGQQTERFLKRYIEIFREQSFAIVSLYKNIFAPPPETELPVPTMPGLNFKTTSMFKSANQPTDPLSRLPPALATFPMHLAEMLMETLRVYLPNVKDKSSRESLLTQVLYCAGSLARLGGDFSMFLSLLAGDYDDDDDNEEGPAEGDSVAEWEEVMKKHRVLAERLDQLTAQAGESGAKSKIATHTH
ncbi:hypothetical protein VTO42DRAFT_4739 [Malbranchea cinnamomea]